MHFMVDEDGCKGGLEAVRNIGVMSVFMLHKNAPDCSDQKSGKWSKVREFCTEN